MWKLCICYVLIHEQDKEINSLCGWHTKHVRIRSLCKLEAQLLGFVLPQSQKSKFFLASNPPQHSPCKSITQAMD